MKRKRYIIILFIIALLLITAVFRRLQDLYNSWSDINTGYGSRYGKGLELREAK